MRTYKLEASWLSGISDMLKLGYWRHFHCDINKGRGTEMGKFSFVENSIKH